MSLTSAAAPGVAGAAILGVMLLGRGLPLIRRTLKRRD
jgi:hypothetical protein